MYLVNKNEVAALLNYSCVSELIHWTLSHIYVLEMRYISLRGWELVSFVSFLLRLNSISPLRRKKSFYKSLLILDLVNNLPFINFHYWLFFCVLRIWNSNKLLYVKFWKVYLPTLPRSCLQNSFHVWRLECEC